MSISSETKCDWLSKLIKFLHVFAYNFTSFISKESQRILCLHLVLFLLFFQLSSLSITHGNFLFMKKY